ncbi:MAG: methyl-accepting chemotaxis protein [Bdellovibrionales bacterium]|nr:methyl-accepting chemotaxis protein [Bdellovibrionales bacterium]
MRLSVTTKFTLLLLPIAAVGVLVSVLAWRCLNKGTASLIEASELHGQALHSELYVSEMGSALKGYLLNPDDAKEADRKATADERNADVLKKMRETTHSPEILKLIEELNSLDEKHLNPAEDAVVDLVKNRKIDEARELFVKKYLPLRALYDELSAALSSKAAHESDLQVAAIASDMRASAREIVFSLWAGLALAAALMVFFTRRLSRTLISVVDELTGEARELSSSSTDLTRTSTALSDGATQQASALQQTAASIEEVSAMVTKNAESAQASKEFADSSDKTARAGQGVVEEMRESIDAIGRSNLAIMDQVNESNRQMAEITRVISEIGVKTKVINDIVFQTRLLSFNASVEAARAGEHGKGFAVVAEEVGNLAQMSGNAAQDIHSMLESSIQRVQSIADDTKAKVETLIVTAKSRIEAGTQTANRCASALGEIVDQAGKLTELMGSIAGASGEQAAGVREINQAVSQLDQLTQENAKASSGTAATAERLRGQAGNLLGAVDHLRSTVTGEPLPVRDHGPAEPEASSEIGEAVERPRAA